MESVVFQRLVFFVKRSNQTWLASLVYARCSWLCDSIEVVVVVLVGALGAATTGGHNFANCCVAGDDVLIENNGDDAAENGADPVDLKKRRDTVVTRGLLFQRAE